jgi:hypothetical protein
MRAHSPLPFLGKAILSLLLLAQVGVSSGQPFSEGAFAARSLSGQFVVQGQRSTALPYRLLALATNQNYVCLEPTLVTVSCERIRQLLARELGFGNVWQGKVYISFRRVVGPNDEVSLTSSRFSDGWQYRLEMPELVHRHKYVVGVVRALLLEFANRQSEDRSAELPPWLAEGLAQQILNSGEIEIILPPPRLRQNFAPPAEVVDAKRASPLGAVHKLFAGTPPLTFEELSWPGGTLMDAEAYELYRNSASLFLVSISQLREGRASLRAMLERLPRFYNWQFAFLDAFRGYFSRPLDVEKWWALQTLRFTSRDLAQAWSPEESRLKLGEVLQVPARVYQAGIEMPEQSEVTLQTVVTTWSVADQRQALETKLRQLELLETRLAPELVSLAQSYRRALLAYFQDHLQAQPSRRAVPASSGLKPFSKAMASRLDELDHRRAEESANPRL